MLSIGTLSAGRGFYYTDLAQEQYYTKGGEPPGRWYGQASERLGFFGEVTKDHLHQALQGFDLHGAPLVQNAGKENRQAGLDLTFSADKSVSVAWAVGDEETKRGLERAHGKAVEAALGYLEREAAWTRRGHGGTEFEKCQLVFAWFDHGTSRAGDPNLHTHVLVPNLGLREDGMTASLWSHELYLHKMAAGALYRAALAYELGPAGLGYALEKGRTHGTFRLKHVPHAVCEHFSKRRAQIEAELQEHGYSKTAKRLDQAALKTREVKGHAARADLCTRWEQEARELGFTGLPKAKGERSPLRSLFVMAEQEVERLVAEHAAFRPQDLVRAVAHLGIWGRTPPDQLLKEVDQVLALDHMRTVHQGERHPVLTTHEQLARENCVLHLAQRVALPDDRFVVPEGRAQRVMRANEHRNLDSTERQKAFQFLTTEPGNLKVLAGVAGTGKTSLLRAARKAWEANGFRVLGMAVAGKAARELAKGSGIDAETVCKREMQMGLLSKGKQDPFKSDLDFGDLSSHKRTVLVVDECSMLGLVQTQRLLKLAADTRSKIVLLGDERQLPAICSVSPFEAISKVVPRFELTDIRRQKEGWMRHAVEALANGDTETGLSLLKSHGSLHMGRGGAEATKDALVAEWLKSDGPVKEKLILAATNEEVGDLNARAQKAREDAGELGKFLSVQLGSGEVGRIGDRVLFRKNDRDLKVFNGELGTITSILHPAVPVTGRQRGVATIRMDHGARVLVELNHYKNTSLGYALTTHKAQGTTVDQCFTYTTTQRAARDMQYVQVSRARERMMVYVPGRDLGEDLQDFKLGLKQESASRELASERGRRMDRELEKERRERSTQVAQRGPTTLQARIRELQTRVQREERAVESERLQVRGVSESLQRTREDLRAKLDPDEWLRVKLAEERSRARERLRQLDQQMQRGI